jgi:hypothetical protein
MLAHEAGQILYRKLHRAGVVDGDEYDRLAEQVRAAYEAAALHLVNALQIELLHTRAGNGPQASAQPSGGNGVQQSSTNNLASGKKDQTRGRILAAVRDGSKVTVQELQRVLPLSESTLYMYLGELEALGHVQHDGAARGKRYWATSSPRPTDGVARGPGNCHGIL